ncbi:MAG: SRPBCC family protein [Bacteroidota bacterium]
MKYTVEVEIDKPLQKVVEVFRNTENYYDWMQGLEKIEQLSGTPGSEGAETLLHFKMGKRRMQMKETVLRANLPDSYLVSYDVKGVYNEVDNKFESIDNNRTLYTTANYFRFSGLMKLFSLFGKKSFTKQSLKYANDFKKFVEEKYEQDD